MTNKKYLLMVILLIGASIFLVIGYQAGHRQHAGQLVRRTCSGTYITVESLGLGINGGGPCLSSEPFVLANNYRLYYASLATFGAVLIGSGILFLVDRRSKTRAKR